MSDQGDWNPMNLEFGQGDVLDRDPVKLQPDEELENFLGRVDEISAVIKSLSSEDPSENERGFRKADILLRRDEEKEKALNVDGVECTVTKDRTVINKAKDEGAVEGKEDTQAFMRMMEKDAKERAENRKERKLKSDAFRKQGNMLFAKKEFTGALLNYNEAIKLIKDSPCLYNNRALTYIRLGIFSSAVEDCQRAIELEEFSLRGRMFLAKSYFLMGQAQKCRGVLEQAREKMPGHLELIDNYQIELFNMGPEKPFDFDLESEKKWQAAAKGEFPKFEVQKDQDEEDEEESKSKSKSKPTQDHNPEDGEREASTSASKSRFKKEKESESSGSDPRAFGDN